MYTTNRGVLRGSVVTCTCMKRNLEVQVTLEPVGFFFRGIDLGQNTSEPQPSTHKNQDVGWLVVLRFNATLTAKVMMAVGDAHVFPGFLTPVLTLLFFTKSPTTFLTCFCRGERRKYAGKKSRLNRGSNSQPPGHESDTLTT